MTHHPPDTRQAALILGASPTLGYAAIAALVGAPKSTVFRWLEDCKGRSRKSRRKRQAYQRRWKRAHPEAHRMDQRAYYMRRKLQ